MIVKLITGMLRPFCMVMRQGTLVTDVTAMIGVLVMHRLVVKKLRLLGDDGDDENQMEFDEGFPVDPRRSAEYTRCDPCGSVPVLHYNSTKEDRYSANVIKKGKKPIGKSEETKEMDSNKLDTHAPETERCRGTDLTNLQDGALVVLSGGEGRFLGTEVIGDAYSLDVILCGTGICLSKAEWLDGAVRLPTVPFECVFTIKRKGKDSFGFSSTRAGGRFIRAIKSEDEKIILGGNTPNKQELWSLNEEGDSFFNVAFSNRRLQWQVVEVRATPTIAMREAERVQMREVRQMRNQVQSAELRVRDSDKKTRDSVAMIQQEAHNLRFLCDQQQCKIENLQSSLKNVTQELKSSKASAAELDRLVVQMAGEKQKALTAAQLEQEKEVLQLRTELSDVKYNLENRISSLLMERKRLEDESEQMVSSLSSMNTRKDAELHELQREKVKLSSTLNDIAAKVGSVSPIPPSRKDIYDTSSYLDTSEIHSRDLDIPNIEISRTFGGGRRIGAPGGGNSAAVKLF